MIEEFSAATRAWFTEAFREPTAAQAGAWRAISRGEHALVVAPTGSGKTLAAFLWSLDRLASAPPPSDPRHRCRVLYISPLKALGVDVERNLRVPLAGIRQAARRLGLPEPEIKVGVRSGDTPSSERRRLVAHPPDILITTPESLFLLLTSQARESLRGVETVIVDEVHAVAATKRGAHLALSLERLDALLPVPAQRIGLSATVRPLPEVSAFLGGSAPVTVVRPADAKTFDLRIIVPVEDLTTLSDDPEPHRRSLWPHVEEHILSLIAAHRSTLIFANSRRLAERLCTRLNTLATTHLHTLPTPHPTPEHSTDTTQTPQEPGPSTGTPHKTATRAPKDNKTHETDAPQAQQNHDPSTDASREGTAHAPKDNKTHETDAPRAQQNHDPSTGTSHEGADLAPEGGKSRDTDMTRARRASGPLEASRGTAVLASEGDGIRGEEGALGVLVRRVGREGVVEVARAHHGSVSKEERAGIEEALKRGRLPAVVATSSLELGIDMGAVDLVVQVESPPSVAGGLQRVGRAGHQVGAVSRGVIFPKYRGDLVQAAVVAERMREGRIEALRYPRNPLDVLAQQIVAMVAMDEWQVDELEAVVRRAAPFAGLSRPVYEATLDMLAGRYPGEEFGELRPRLVWDRVEGTLRARRGAQRLAVVSGGTIPDRGLFGIFLAGEKSSRVGELDEEMVYESRVGDVFVLGASSWRIEEITSDRVLVSPASGRPGRLPFWHGDSPGRPAELGRALGAFTRELCALPEDRALERAAAAGLDPRAADNLLSYLAEQEQATGQVPDDRTLVVERFRDELGDWRLIVHSPYGALVHAPWALAIAGRLRERFGLDAQAMHADDGIVLRVPDTDGLPPSAELCVFDPEEIERIVVAELGSSALFAARFRECAARSLLLPRHRPGRRMPLWQQRQRASQLLAVAAKYPDFPIVLETVRECLQDVFDVPGLVDLMRDISARRARITEVETPAASPYAQSLLFRYIAAFMYEGDSPLAERKAQALTLDSSLLSDLLGHSDLRDLLDPTVLSETAAELQHLTPTRQATDPDTLTDLLRALGPLSLPELHPRSHPSPVTPHPAQPKEPSQPQPPTKTPEAEHPAETPQTQHPAKTPQTECPTKTSQAEHPAKTPQTGHLAETPQTGHPAETPQTGHPAETSEAGCLAETPGDGWLVGDERGVGVAWVEGWVGALEEERRVIRVRVAGVERWAAVEDAARLRDALGTVLPAGIPEAFLEPVDDPLGDLLVRYARTHVPFSAVDVAERYGLGTAVVTDVLKRLPSVVEGEFTPGVTGTEWVDADVLRMLRRRSLARLRAEVEPSPPEALARFLPRWQGVGSRHGGLDSLFQAIERLQGVPVPASALETLILPSRVPGYTPALLDELTSAGEVLWLGRGALPGNDGWISLYPADTAPLLLPAPADVPATPLHSALLDALADDGSALFFRALADRVRAHPDLPGYPDDQEILQALWDLVWAGRLTNDTLAPLRSALGTRRSTPRSRPGRRGRPVLSARTGPPTAAGRWWPPPAPHPDPTRRAHALSEALLDRYGIVLRGAVAAEHTPGGFASVYPVLRAQEEAGHCRRGYFVDGLGAAQFALPGAVDLLRSLRPPQTGEPPTKDANDHAVVLAAADPANPYGAALPWPEGTAGHRPGRKAGALVVLVEGVLTLYTERGGKSLLSWNEPAHRPAIAALARTIREGTLNSLTIERANGTPVAASPLAPLLEGAGFHPTPRGLRLRR